MPLASVAASQVRTIDVSDCATALTLAGTEGGVVSDAGGGGGGGADELSSPPPPQADRPRVSATRAALEIVIRMRVSHVRSCRTRAGNLPTGGRACRRTPGSGMESVRRRR